MTLQGESHGNVYLFWAPLRSMADPAGCCRPLERCCHTQDRQHPSLSLVPLRSLHDNPKINELKTPKCHKMRNHQTLKMLHQCKDIKMLSSFHSFSQVCEKWIHFCVLDKLQKMINDNSSEILKGYKKMLVKKKKIGLTMPSYTGIYSQNWVGLNF